MRKIKTKTAAVLIAAAMLLTGCGNNEKPNENSGTANDDRNSTSDDRNSTSKVFGLGDEVSEPTKELGIWDVLPEIPVTDASAFTYKYDSDLGGMVVTDYLNESPKVRIPDTLEGEPVIKVDFEKMRKELTELIIPNSVKSFTLSDSIKKALQYVNIPKGVTEIENNTFSGCTNLTSIYVPDSVTEIGHEAFERCTILSSITIPDSVTEIYYSAFSGCTSLTSINIPNGMTEIGDYAFRNCESLKSVNVPDSVTEIGYGAFNNCTSLTSATYKGKSYDYEHIDDLYDAIKFGESGMIIEGGVLKDISSKLTEVTIPDSVTEIGKNAFSGCRSLTSVTIPDSVTKIGSDAFKDCESLTAEYKGKSYDYEHIDDLYDAINLGESGMLIEGGVLKDVSRKLTKVTIPENVTSIDVEAFKDCIDIVSIIIPNSVTSISERTLEYCTNLTSATYRGKNYDYSHIDELYDAINMGDSGLLIKNGILTKVDGELTEVVIPNGVTEIGDEAFKGCTRLTKIIISDSVIKSSKNVFDEFKNAVVSYKNKTYDYEHREDLYYDINFQKGDIIMPNLIGMSSEDVKITCYPFNIEIAQRYSEAPEGEVLEQHPSEGDILKSGSSIMIIISIGHNRNYEIQDLTNMSEAAAKKQLEKDGFLVRTTYQSSDIIPKGHVIRTEPSAHELAEYGSTIILVVSR